MTTRAIFEKWASEQGFAIERCDTGEYRTSSTDAAWGGWLACSDEAEIRHSLACAEWARICEMQKRHGAKVGAQECANLLRGWRVNKEPKPHTPIKIIPIENRPGLSLVSAEMIDYARKIVCENNRPSISFVQRVMRISYNQAARIIEHLEKEGTVSPASASGLRTIVEPPNAK